MYSIFRAPRSRNLWLDRARHDVAGADRYIEHLYEVCRLLADNPTLGEPCFELARGMYCLREGKNRVFYRLGDNKVILVRLLRTARRSAVVFGYDLPAPTIDNRI